MQLQSISRSTTLCRVVAFDGGKSTIRPIATCIGMCFMVVKCVGCLVILGIGSLTSEKRKAVVDETAAPEYIIRRSIFMYGF